jgi:hypothetical protein
MSCPVVAGIIPVGLSIGIRPAAVSAHAGWTSAFHVWRARLAAATVVVSYFVVLFARGGHRAWGHFGVWTLSPSFLDLRSVTSAWECVRRGIAVLPSNPCDPLKRPANYPTVWLLPSHLGLGQSSTVALGIVTALVFFGAALAVIPQHAEPWEGLVYGVALCSPSVMLGVERGNVDLLVFAVIVAAMAFFRRSGPSAVVSPLLVLIAAILKLFPILAAPALLRRDRRGFYAFGAVSAAFGVYALATLGTIRDIRRFTPQLTAYSYGVKPFGIWAANLFATYRIHLAASVWDWLLVTVIVAAAVIVQPRVQRRLFAGDEEAAARRDLDLFVVGGVIFVATFFVIQSFEYRLVFLVLTIPQLLRWTRAGRVLGIVGLLLTLLTFWLGAPWNGVPVIDTLINRWQWLTSQRPLFGVDQDLSAAASVQVMLAAVLLVLLVAALPRILRRGSAADGAA